MGIITKKDLKKAKKNLMNLSLEEVIDFKEAAVLRKDYETAACFRDRECQLTEDSVKVKEFPSLGMETKLEDLIEDLESRLKGKNETVESKYVLKMIGGSIFTITEGDFDSILRKLTIGTVFIMLDNTLINLKRIEEIVPYEND